MVIPPGYRFLNYVRNLLINSPDKNQFAKAGRNRHTNKLQNKSKKIQAKRAKAKAARKARKINRK